MPYKFTSFQVKSVYLTSQTTFNWNLKVPTKIVNLESVQNLLE